MWLTNVSIRRPVFITMVVLALIVLGFTSRGKMKAELIPKIDLPFISIVTVYPGAGPQEIETLVSKPIEDAIGSTANLKNVTSTSQDGISMVGLEFELGTDIDTAAADVRDKLSAIRGSLPRDIIEPSITKADISAEPIVTMAMKSNMPSRDQRIIADKMIKDTLGKVGGVAAVYVSGGQERQVNVSVDIDRLQAYGLTIDQLAQSLQAENLNLPSGAIKEGPEGKSSRDYAVRTVGEFKNAEEISNIKLKLQGNQGPVGEVRLGDIAKVTDSIKDPDILTRLNGTDTVTLAVQKQSNANTVAVADGVKEEIERLNGYKDKKTGKEVAGLLPKGTSLNVTKDDSIFVKDALSDVNRALLEGILLVVIIVFLFLHSGRATFIVACAIPTSIVATFLPIQSFGFTLNMMTLLALALCVGILVDDSIVVLENIERHLRKGERPKDAALNGRSEIGLAAITITLVDVVVFVPIAFMGGIVGQFFRQFGITVAVATLFSLFMSFTLTPMLASRWLKSKEQEDEDERRLARSPVTRLFHRFEDFYCALDARYRGMLQWALENRFLTIVIGIVTLFLVIGMLTPLPYVEPDTKHMAKDVVMKMYVPRIFILLFSGILLALSAAINPKGRRVAIGYSIAFILLLFTIKFPLGNEFMPEVDYGQFSVSIELPAGSGLGATDRVARQVEGLVEKTPGVKYYMTTVGSASAGYSGTSTGPQYAKVNIQLHDFGKERPTPIKEIVSGMTEKTALIPGGTIRLSSEGQEGMGGQPIQMEITGANQDELVRIADQVELAIKKVPGTEFVTNSWDIGKPELRVTIDRLRAADLGVSVYQIANALRTSIEGNTDAKLRDRGDEYDIRVQLARSDRERTSDVQNFVVGTKDGMPIYLRDVAKVELGPAPTKYDRKNRQRLITVGANVQSSGGYTLGNVQSAVNKSLEKINKGSAQIKVGGSSDMMNESFGYLFGALFLAIALVYMLMGALFESFITPLVIMLSLPQALVGALLLMMITGNSLSLITMIGFIMLVGLVTKNAILLVDYTNTLRERGLKRNDAVLEAGPTRLRPILMTTMAMVGGMLPTALALSKGSEQRAPMAVAVIGGLLMSTLLTLLVIPTAYTIADDWWSAIRRWFGYKEKPHERIEPDYNAEPGLFDDSSV